MSDQHGRPIPGVEVEGKKILFALGPPNNDDKPGARKMYATHAQTIAALDAERVDWTKLACAGFPQLTYDELRALKNLPPTPIEELRKIQDSALRRDALRARREADEVIAAEVAALNEE